MAGPIGYPDYQRLSNVDSPTLVSEPQIGRVAVQTGGDLDVSRYSHLRLRMISDQKGSYLFAKFLWKRTFNGGEIEGERTIIVSPLNQGPEGELMCSVANLGPFVKWEVGEITLGLKEWLSEWRIAADNRNLALECPITQAALLKQREVILPAAGGTVNAYPAYYYSGPALLFISNFTTAGMSVQIETYDLTSKSWVTVAQYFAKTTVAESFPVYLPLGAWRVGVTNATGAEHKVFVAVAPSPTGG